MQDYMYPPAVIMICATRVNVRTDGFRPDILLAQPVVLKLLIINALLRGSGCINSCVD